MSPFGNAVTPNVSEILARKKENIQKAIMVIVVAGVFLGLVVSLRKLYPLGLIAIGRNVDWLKKLERRREILLVGVVIAFVVNLAAGVVLLIKF